MIYIIGKFLIIIAGIFMRNSFYKLTSLLFAIISIGMILNGYNAMAGHVDSGQGDGILCSNVSNNTKCNAQVNGTVIQGQCESGKCCVPNGACYS